MYRSCIYMYISLYIYIYILSLSLSLSIYIYIYIYVHTNTPHCSSLIYYVAPCGGVAYDFTNYTFNKSLSFINKPCISPLWQGVAQRSKGLSEIIVGQIIANSPHTNTSTASRPVGASPKQRRSKFGVWVKRFLKRRWWLFLVHHIPGTTGILVVDYVAPCGGIPWRPIHEPGIWNFRALTQSYQSQLWYACTTSAPCGGIPCNNVNHNSNNHTYTAMRNNNNNNNTNNDNNKNNVHI